MFEQQQNLQSKPKHFLPLVDIAFSVSLEKKKKLRFDRKQNSVKQLSFNKKINKKSKLINTTKTKHTIPKQNLAYFSGPEF